MIRVVNRKTYKGKTQPIYCGRPTLLGNSFIIGKDGTREEVIAKYEKDLRYKLSIEKSAYLKEIYRLLKIAQHEDLVLSCWCKPLPCHVDVIKKILEELLQKVGREV